MALPSPRRSALPYARSSNFFVVVALGKGRGPTSESESESTARETERDLLAFVVDVFTTVAPVTAVPEFETIVRVVEVAGSGTGGRTESSLTTHSLSASSAFGNGLRLGLGLSGRLDLLLLRPSLLLKSWCLDTLLLLFL